MAITSRPYVRARQKRRALFVVFLLAVVALVWWLRPAPAHAHESWISKNRLTDPASGEWCCNHNDCREETVSEVYGGYLTQGGDVVPYVRVLWRSPDGSWWRCRVMGGPNINKTRCLIGPPPSG